MRTLEEILTKEYLARLQQLGTRLRARLGTDGYSGARRSTVKGTSLEFSDFREYLPGDDLRRADWNSYARFDKLYVKQYFEEKQAAFHLFLDCSRSMEAGEKFLQAKALAASVGYLAMSGGDQARFFAFREGLAAKESGLSQQSRFLQAVRFLQPLTAEGGTDLLRAVREAGTLQKGVSVLFSDFMVEKGLEEAVKLLQEKKQDVILVQVLSREELSPAAQGPFRLTDSETGQAIDVELTAGVLAAYQKALAQQENGWQEFCRRRNARFLRVAEDAPLLESVYDIMK